MLPHAGDMQLLCALKLQKRRAQAVARPGNHPDINRINSSIMSASPGHSATARQMQMPSLTQTHCTEECHRIGNESASACARSQVDSPKEIGHGKFDGPTNYEIFADAIEVQPDHDSAAASDETEDDNILQ